MLSETVLRRFARNRYARFQSVLVGAKMPLEVVEHDGNAKIVGFFPARELSPEKRTRTGGADLVASVPCADGFETL